MHLLIIIAVDSTVEPLADLFCTAALSTREDQNQGLGEPKAEAQQHCSSSCMALYGCEARAEHGHYLQEVSAICPQRRHMGSHHRRARRAGEAADELAARITVGRILALHRTACLNNKARPSGSS